MATTCVGAQWRPIDFRNFTAPRYGDTIRGCSRANFLIIFICYFPRACATRIFPVYFYYGFTGIPYESCSFPSSPQPHCPLFFLIPLDLCIPAGIIVRTPHLFLVLVKRIREKPSLSGCSAAFIVGRRTYGTTRLFSAPAGILLSLIPH